MDSSNFFTLNPDISNMAETFLKQGMGFTVTFNTPLTAHIHEPDGENLPHAYATTVATITPLTLPLNLTQAVKPTKAKKKQQ